MRRNASIIDDLARVPMFADCSNRELQHVAKLLTEIDVQAGRQLTTEAEAGHEFFIVLDGNAEVTIDGRTVATLTSGDYFGEVALLGHGPRTATVTALTAMTLAVVGQREFSALLDEAPALTRSMLNALARRLSDHDTAVLTA
ncbi:MAG: cyclic nucleotide-binding domain-containing protein [Jatrophihabitantaceae bacterium]